MEPNEYEEPEQLTALCVELGITAECKEGARSPRMIGADDKWKADSWTVTLRFAGRKHVTDFWCGIGHREIFTGPAWQRPKVDGWRRVRGAEDFPHVGRISLYDVENSWYRAKPPTAADVLGSLLSDAQSAENARNFEDFASDAGYDPDSRTAERIYQACLMTFRDMHAFCGEHYERLSRAEH